MNSCESNVWFNRSNEKDVIDVYLLLYHSYNFHIKKPRFAKSVLFLIGLYLDQSTNDKKYLTMSRNLPARATSLRRELETLISKEQMEGWIQEMAKSILQTVLIGGWK